MLRILLLCWCTDSIFNVLFIRFGSVLTSLKTSAWDTRPAAGVSSDIFWMWRLSTCILLIPDALLQSPVICYARQTHYSHVFSSQCWNPPQWSHLTQCGIRTLYFHPQSQRTPSLVLRLKATACQVNVYLRAVLVVHGVSLHTSIWIDRCDRIQLVFYALFVTPGVTHWAPFYLAKLFENGPI